MPTPYIGTYYAAGVIEWTSTSGLGSYVLGGNLPDSSSFRQRVPDGSYVTYRVRNGSKQELIKGHFFWNENILTRERVILPAGPIDWGPGIKFISLEFEDNPLVGLLNYVEQQEQEREEDEDAILALFNITSPNENDILQYEGANGQFINVRPRVAIGFGTDPTALLTANQEVLNYPFSVGVTFLDNFADYRGWSSTVSGRANATAAVVLVVRKAVAASPLSFSDVGTITISLGTVGPGTFATTGGDLVFAKNDVIQIRAPASADATFKGLFGSLVGFET
jgi:hypothetical protein